MWISNEQIFALRPQTARPKPGNSPLDVLYENEPTDILGGQASVTTILLRGSECSFRCLMCDLWKYTHTEPTQVGSIPQQIVDALNRQPPITCGQANRWLKLYNASNFFSPRNIPTVDLLEIANLVKKFDRVIVENHPRLIVPAIADFRKALDSQLEVAMGLETVHPEILSRLNKQMNTDDFARACQWLLSHDVSVRAFVLLRPPGLSEEAGIEWCFKSLEMARSWGVRHVSIIPTRAGNGAIEALAERKLFEPPLAQSLYRVLSESIGKYGDMVVTADLWDFSNLRGLGVNASQLERSMEQMNLRQRSS